MKVKSLACVRMMQWVLVLFVEVLTSHLMMVENVEVEHNTYWRMTFFLRYKRNDLSFWMIRT